MSVEADCMLAAVCREKIACLSWTEVNWRCHSHQTAGRGGRGEGRDVEGEKIEMDGNVCLWGGDTGKRGMDGRCRSIVGEVQAGMTSAALMLG